MSRFTAKIIHMKRGEMNEIHVLSGYQPVGGIPDFQWVFFLLCFVAVLEGSVGINCF